MKIKGMKGLDGQQLSDELQRGGRFVIYEYCMSILLLTLKRPSDVYFIRAGESAVGKGLGFSFLTLVVGWWGIPWGPVYTISSVVTNFRGGKDVTKQVLISLHQAGVGRQRG